MRSWTNRRRSARGRQKYSTGSLTFVGPSSALFSIGWWLVYALLVARRSGSLSEQVADKIGEFIGRHNFANISRHERQRCLLLLIDVSLGDREFFALCVC